MLKPLSPKTIAKMYAESGLPQDKIDVLRLFFRCAANVYGVIILRDAWEIFKQYEGNTFVRKKDFLAFSDIVRREAGLPYTLYDLKDVYSGEDSDKPIDRLIVNNRLLTRRSFRYEPVYATVEHQDDLPLFIPDKQEFYSFGEDRFYQTDIGRKVKSFIGNLKTDGISKDYQGEVVGEIFDTNREPVKGKRLCDCVFLTEIEKVDVEYTKRETQKHKLLERYSIPASEKILSDLEDYLMTGGVFGEESIAVYLGHLFEALDREYGVILTSDQLETLVDLIMTLNNNSNLWQNNGWRPVDLMRRFPGNAMSAISFGPNMQRMFETGELDREEYVKALAEIGINVIDK